MSMPRKTLDARHAAKTERSNQVRSSGEGLGTALEGVEIPLFLEDCDVEGVQ